jgi:hypothetical protein
VIGKRYSVIGERDVADERSPITSVLFALKKGLLSMNHWKDEPWKGVFPATFCPFREDYSLDEEGLRSYIGQLCEVVN